MKLVELLAKQIAEWPEGAEHAIQDDDGCFKFGAGKNPKIYSDGIWVRDIEIEHELYNGFHSSEKTSDRESAIVTREQWQAERDRQKGGEWNRHRGGKQPVLNEVFVEYKLRDGVTGECRANQLDWFHDKSGHDVMQYKVISQPQAEEVEVKDTTIGTLSYKVEIDTTEASQAIDDLTAKWDQIETPFKWRDEVTELNAYIEEFTREREALINRLAVEGFALLPAMTPVMGGADVPVHHDHWQDGDIVRCVKTGDSVAALTIGKEYTVTFQYDSIGVIDDEEDHMTWCVECGELEFVRRP